MVTKERNFAKLAHKAALGGINFDDWYDEASKDDEPKKEPQKAGYPISEPDELFK